MAGNILSGQSWLLRALTDEELEDAATQAVRLARAIVAEVERTTREKETKS